MALIAAALPAAAQAAAPVAQNGLSPEGFLNPDGTLNIPDGFSGSFDLEGWQVSLDDSRGPRLRPAAAPADDWEALADNGLNNTVYALAVVGTDLYVGGQFTQSFGGATGGLNRIARYDTAAGSWQALADNGLNDRVFALAVVGTDLYVGGRFSQSSGGATGGLNNIARYDTAADSWHALADNGLDPGLTNSVQALAVEGTDLYVGGEFSQSSGGATGGLNNIARYDTAAGSWHALADNGLDNAVNALAVVGTDLYVGGGFSQSSGGATGGLNNIARYDTATDSWQALADDGLSSRVHALAVMGTDLYVGGQFIQSSGGATGGLNRIARYDTAGDNWQGLADDGLNGPVRALAVVGTDLYVGGDFTQSNGGATGGLTTIARYDTGADNWQALADNGLNDEVQALAVLGTDLYVGGQFSQSAGGANTDLNNIAGYGLPVAEEEAQADGPTVNKDIAATGTTTLYTGRIAVLVPASAIPSGESDCYISITQKGDSGSYGFELDDTVWDVKIYCDSGEINIFFDAISVCIRPLDGKVSDKQVFHRHSGGFGALASTGQLAGYICGQTRTLSLFTLGELGLPATGFAPGGESALGAQPPELAYAATPLTLDIPTLDVQLPIVGVPQTPNGWDVSWLGNSAGFLQGTAFPTLTGNTVITAHVWGADNQPGPFAGLESLQHGERFSIEAWGQTYTYEVRGNALYSPNALSPLGSEDYDWVTLVTCSGFDEASGEYQFRRVVRAVLVEVGN